MKGIRILILSILSWLGILFLLIIALEPHYLNQIINNTLESPNNPISIGLIKQDFSKWEKHIKKDTYIEIPLKEIKRNQIVISVITGKISYHLYSQNSSFKSFISPSKYYFIDLSTGISKNNIYDCIRIAYFNQNENKNEKCKYVVILSDNYPILRLEMYSLNRTWAVVLIENN